MAVRAWYNATIALSLMPLDPHLAPVPRLLEVSHVAHRLSASQEYVRRLIREHKLPAIRLGTRWRVDPHDLEAFIEAHRQQIAAGERAIDRALAAGEATLRRARG
jgi:excisionase family DNA binding protein